MVLEKYRCESKRVNVSLSGEQMRLIRKLKGTMGNSDSEIVRNILIAWFSEKNMILLNDDETE